MERLYIWFFMGLILPVKLDKFDLVLVSKTPIVPIVVQNIQIERKKTRNTSRPNKSIRIDAENYEEPTEVPDLDDFEAFLKETDTWKKQIYSRVLGLNDDKNYKRERETNNKKDRNNKNEKERDSKKKKDRDNKKGKNSEEEVQNNDFYAAILRNRGYDTNENSQRIKRVDDSDEFETFGDDKIVGGKEVDINLYPYHVGYGTNCGGAIIDKRWILTAGHCGSKPYIRVGSKFLNQGTKINIKHSYVHPIWAAKSKDHPFDFDFQLLETAEPIKFDENTQPTKVARIEDMVIGKIITVTGWGNTEENGPYSSVLRAVRVPIISKENCQNVPFPYFRGRLTSRMFCAGFDEGKKDACQGDSGGPAVSHDRLLGMVSFGYGCATPGSYGVYSKVAKVRNWIEQITGLTLD